MDGEQCAQSDQQDRASYRLDEKSLSIVHAWPPRRLEPCRTAADSRPGEGNTGRRVPRSRVNTTYKLRSRSAAQASIWQSGETQSGSECEARIGNQRR